MRHPLFLTLVLLAACGTAQVPTSPRQTSLPQELQNPLVADRYWSELAEHMADFTRHKDPILRDGGKALLIEEARKDALAQAEQVRQRMSDGIEGGFLSSQDPVRGSALVRGTTVYFSSDFLTFPTPAMRVYLTSVVDPRGIPFPDKASVTVDLGPLQTPYGPQEYVSAETIDESIRTVVLYDTELDRIYGFAQLSR